jgi:hypothetical protein
VGDCFKRRSLGNVYEWKILREKAGYFNSAKNYITNGELSVNP